MSSENSNFLPQGLSSEDSSTSSSSLVSSDKDNIQSAQRFVHLKETKTHLFCLFPRDNHEKSKRGPQLIRIKISKRRPQSRHLENKRVDYSTCQIGGSNVGSVVSNDQENYSDYLNSKKTPTPHQASNRKLTNHPSFVVLPETKNIGDGNGKKTVFQSQSSDNSNETYIIRSRKDNKLLAGRTNVVESKSLFQRYDSCPLITNTNIIRGSTDLRQEDYCKCAKGVTRSSLDISNREHKLKKAKGDSSLSPKNPEPEIFNIQFIEPMQASTSSRLKAGQDREDNGYKIKGSHYACPEITRIFPPEGSSARRNKLKLNYSESTSDGYINDEMVKINYNLVRRCLLVSPANEKCEVLEALRSRIKSKTLDVAINTVEDIVKYDLFGVKSERPLLQALIWPLNNGVPHPLQTCIVRLINALVSFEIGREYFNNRSIIGLLIWGAPDRDNIEQEMADNLIATMMKLSYNQFQCSDMIKNGLFKWLMNHLEEIEYSASSHHLECTSRLLRNLIYEENSIDFSETDIRNWIVILGKYLDTEHEVVKKNILASLVSLFQRRGAIASANEMNFSKIIQNHIKSSTNSKEKERLQTLNQLLKGQLKPIYDRKSTIRFSTDGLYLDDNINSVGDGNVDDSEKLLREKFSVSVPEQSSSSTSRQEISNNYNQLECGNLISRIFVEHLHCSLPKIDRNRIFPAFNYRFADRPPQTCVRLTDPPMRQSRALVLKIRKGFKDLPLPVGTDKHRSQDTRLVKDLDQFVSVNFSKKSSSNRIATVSSMMKSKKGSDFNVKSDKKSRASKTDIVNSFNPDELENKATSEEKTKTLFEDGSSKISNNKKSLATDAAKLRYRNVDENKSLPQSPSVTKHTLNEFPTKPVHDQQTYAGKNTIASKQEVDSLNSDLKLLTDPKPKDQSVVSHQRNAAAVDDKGMDWANLSGKQQLITSESVQKITNINEDTVDCRLLEYGDVPQPIIATTTKTEQSEHILSRQPNAEQPLSMDHLSDETIVHGAAVSSSQKLKEEQLRSTTVESVIPVDTLSMIINTQSNTQPSTADVIGTTREKAALSTIDQNLKEKSEFILPVTSVVVTENIPIKTCASDRYLDDDNMTLKQKGVANVKNVEFQDEVLNKQTEDHPLPATSVINSKQNQPENIANTEKISQYGVDLRRHEESDDSDPLDSQNIKRKIDRRLALESVDATKSTTIRKRTSDQYIVDDSRIVKQGLANAKSAPVSLYETVESEDYALQQSSTIPFIEQAEPLSVLKSNKGIVSVLSDDARILNQKGVAKEIPTESAQSEQHKSVTSFEQISDENELKEEPTVKEGKVERITAKKKQFAKSSKEINRILTVRSKELIKDTIKHHASDYHIKDETTMQKLVPNVNSVPELASTNGKAEAVTPNVDTQSNIQQSKIDTIECKDETADILKINQNWKERVDRQETLDSKNTNEKTKLGLPVGSLNVIKKTEIKTRTSNHDLVDDNRAAKQEGVAGITSVPELSCKTVEFADDVLNKRTKYCYSRNQKEKTNVQREQLISVTSLEVLKAEESQTQKSTQNHVVIEKLNEQSIIMPSQEQVSDESELKKELFDKRRSGEEGIVKTRSNSNLLAETIHKADLKLQITAKSDQSYTNSDAELNNQQSAINTIVPKSLCESVSIDNTQKSVVNIVGSKSLCERVNVDEEAVMNEIQLQNPEPIDSKNVRAGSGNAIRSSPISDQHIAEVKPELVANVKSTPELLSDKESEGYPPQQFSTVSLSEHAQSLGALLNQKKVGKEITNDSVQRIDYKIKQHESQHIEGDFDENCEDGSRKPKQDDEIVIAEPSVSSGIVQLENEIMNTRSDHQLGTPVQMPKDSRSPRPSSGVNKNSNDQLFNLNESKSEEQSVAATKCYKEFASRSVERLRDKKIARHSSDPIVLNESIINSKQELIVSVKSNNQINVPNDIIRPPNSRLSVVDSSGQQQLINPIIGQTLTEDTTVATLENVKEKLRTVDEYLHLETRTIERKRNRMLAARSVDRAPKTEISQNQIIGKSVSDHTLPAANIKLKGNTFESEKSNEETGDENVDQTEQTLVGTKLKEESIASSYSDKELCAEPSNAEKPTVNESGSKDEFTATKTNNKQNETINQSKKYVESVDVLKGSEIERWRSGERLVVDNRRSNQGASSETIVDSACATIKSLRKILSDMMSYLDSSATLAPSKNFGIPSQMTENITTPPQTQSTLNEKEGVTIKGATEEQYLNEAKSFGRNQVIICIEEMLEERISKLEDPTLSEEEHKIKSMESLVLRDLLENTELLNKVYKKILQKLIPDLQKLIAENHICG